MQGGAWSLYISMIMIIPWQVVVNLPTTPITVNKVTNTTKAL